MTPADQLLARAAELAQRLGVPFVLAVHDTAAGSAKLASGPEGTLEKLKPFLLRQLGEAAAQPEEEIPEVGWNEP